MKREILSLIVVSSFVLPYYDLDIDGVDDSVDLCLNTPFDEVVDKDGCSKSQNLEKSNSRVEDESRILFRVSIDSGVDKEYKREEFLNFYLGYSKKSWDMSISNSSSTLNRALNNLLEDSSLYICVGKNIPFPRGNFKVALETKVALEDKRRISGFSKRDGIKKGSMENSSYQHLKREYQNSSNSFFISSDFSYLLTQNWGGFIYYMLPLKEHRKFKPTYHPLISSGVDYSFSKSIYTSLSYTYIGSIRKRKALSESIDFLLNYALNNSYFLLFGYTHSLKRDSYDNIFSIGAGVLF